VLDSSLPLTRVTAFRSCDKFYFEMVRFKDDKSPKTKWKHGQSSRSLNAVPNPLPVSKDNVEDPAKLERIRVELIEYNARKYRKYLSTLSQHRRLSTLESSPRAPTANMVDADPNRNDKSPKERDNATARTPSGDVDPVNIIDKGSSNRDIQGPLISHIIPTGESYGEGSDAEANNRTSAHTRKPSQKLMESLQSSPSKIRYDRMQSAPPFQTNTSTDLSNQHRQFSSARLLPVGGERPESKIRPANVKQQPNIHTQSHNTALARSSTQRTPAERTLPSPQSSPRKQYHSPGVKPGPPIHYFIATTRRGVLSKQP